MKALPNKPTSLLSHVRTDQSADPISESEIERINELHVAIKRAARKMLKEAIEIGEFFVAANKKLSTSSSHKSGWGKWIEANFPTMTISTIYRYMDLAKNAEFLKGVPLAPEDMSLAEAQRLIRARKRQSKPRVRSVIVKPDAEPLVVLEAKLKNFVICLWQLRYLQVEIEGLIESAQFSPDQVQRVLQFVCKEHHEVEEEVRRTFQPGLKIVKKGA
jgi:hypothetical protein